MFFFPFIERTTNFQISPGLGYTVDPGCELVETEAEIIPAPKLLMAGFPIGTLLLLAGVALTLLASKKKKKKKEKRR